MSYHKGGQCFEEGSNPWVSGGLREELIAIALQNNILETRYVSPSQILPDVGRASAAL